jgi:hypothetical protein
MLATYITSNYQRDPNKRSSSYRKSVIGDTCTVRGQGALLEAGLGFKILTTERGESTTEDDVFGMQTKIIK